MRGDNADGMVGATTRDAPTGWRFSGGLFYADEFLDLCAVEGLADVEAAL